MGDEETSRLKKEQFRFGSVVPIHPIIFNRPTGRKGDFIMKQAAFIAAATMAVAGFNLLPAHAANGGPTTAPSPMHTIGTMSNNVSHDAASMTPDAKIQNVIARAAKYAMTPKDMARLVSLFPEAQRQSIAKSSTYSDGYGDKLDSRIESISKAWKQKYGETFTISKANAQNFLSPTFASIHTEALGHNNPNLESAVLAIKDAQGNSTSGAAGLPKDQRLENRCSGFTDRGQASCQSGGTTDRS